MALRRGRFPGVSSTSDLGVPTISHQPLWRLAGKGRGVATSAVQVREGVLSGAEPKWCRYSRWLEPMRTALQS